MDNTPPALDPKKVYMLSNGSTTAQPLQTISGTVDDVSPTTVTVAVNGTVQAQAPVNDGIFSLPATLALGSNAVVVTATDAAGNVSDPIQRAITYDPLAASIVAAIPNNAVVVGNAQPQYVFTFTAPVGYTATVTVNGTYAGVTKADPAGNGPRRRHRRHHVLRQRHRLRQAVGPHVGKADPAAGVTDATWTATVNNLLPGLNIIEITATDVTDAAKKSSIVKTITYSIGQPSSAVTKPPQDITTAKMSYTVIGKATPGASIAALVNGAATPVSVTSAGDFALTVTFGDVGIYEVAVSATDSNGVTSYSYRTLIYDKGVPTITYNRNMKRYMATNGILYAKDSSGNFVTTGISGSGTATLDISNYNGASPLNVFALSSGGNSSRDGDLSPATQRKGYVDISDALKALQFSLGKLQPSDEDLLYGDLTMINGKSVPDGKIKLDDVITILHKAVDSEQ